MARPGLWLASLLFACGFTACVTNHEALEKKPAGQGGRGSGGTGAVTAGAPSHRGGSGGELAMGGGHADDEPPGDSLLTIVNGVVDAPAVALCAAKLDDEGKVTPVGAPLTDAPLEFGQSVVVRELDDIDFETDPLQLFVIAGELSRIDGLDCEAALARARAVEAQSAGLGSDLGQGGGAGESSTSNVPVSLGSGGSAGAGGQDSADAAGSGGAAANSGQRAALRVRGLPAISPGTLNAGRSMLLVANGCLGGATYEGQNASDYCGDGYNPREPTVSAILASLSRQVASSHVALQVVHASLASGQVELRSRRPFPSMDSGIGLGSVVFGQVAPRPASTQNTAFDLGSARRYQVTVESQGKELLSQPWSSALAQGGLSELTDGQGYALVFVGPRADSKAVPDLWNAATVTAIAVDPE
ncbi:MAG TPA: hypothetical protein VFK05_38200 [Polyangiaceae bacterium]|nr:hypothetical protein [Polyangiaceae bacterium]